MTLSRLQMLVFLWLVTVPLTLAADDPASRPQVPAPPGRWVDPQGVPGPLVICGGGRIPDEALRFFRQAAGEAARLMVIPTADDAADDEQSQQRSREFWTAQGFGEFAWLHTRSRDEADRDEFVEPLRRATAIWFAGGLQSRLRDAYVGTAVEREVLALHRRGGVIGGTSAGAAIQSRLMVEAGQEQAALSTGFDLLPGAVIDQHFLVRNRRPRLQATVDAHPHTFGVGIDEDTALLVQGRALRVVGPSSVTIYHAAGKDQPSREMVLTARDRGSDLPMLRREARQRAEGDFPLAVPVTPRVEPGALVVVGGGGMPAEIVQTFIELAGGPEASIVVLPTATADPKPVGGEFFERAGARQVTVWPQNDWPEVHEPGLLQALAQARGVWFGGGRQWHFLDAYEDSAVVALLRDVLRRGGVIGGSSAGATILGDYLVRGSPFGPDIMIADGYETGLRFLPGTAIDQHFSQRRRGPDMESLMRRYPQYLGIGIDESTGIVVQGTKARVLGQHEVRFYPGAMADPPVLEPVVLTTGETFDFESRNKVK